MNIRKTEISDIPAVLAVFDEARTGMREAGIPQWSGTYPGEADVLQDIADGCSYVLCSGGQVAATACIRFAEDPNYQKIDGKWPQDVPYGVIHRIASGRDWKKKGCATLLLRHALSLAEEKGITQLRIDTHEKNRPMRAWIAKNGFSCCGTVYMKSDGTPRLAFWRNV